MDHRFQQQNSSDRSRFGGGFGRRSIGRAHVEGNGQLRNKMSGSKIASDAVNVNGSPVRHSLASESQRNSSNKASGTPIRTLIHEEMSREKKVIQPSPSVIAKLMGLDSLPPPQIVAKQQKETTCSYTSYKNHSLGMSTSEHQEFKDVFEIKATTKVEKRKNQPVFKRDSHPKQDDTDVSFIRQKFIEAKRLSTDETLQNSKEFNDALEVLDSNKDLFLKFLEEPISLFTKHVQDLKGFTPAPREEHITVVKSSRGKTYEINDVSCKSEVKTGSCSQMQKDSISTSRKHNTNLFNHLLKEHSGSLSHKLLKTRHAGKTSTGVRSTRIIVLKPNLENVDMTRNVSKPSSHENYPFGNRRQREFQQSGIQELHAEGREPQKLFDAVEVTGQRLKGSREIARAITKQMKRSVSSGSDKMLVSGFNNIKDESSCVLHGMYNSNNSGAYQHSQDNFDYWSRASSPSSCSSTESSMSREARKRLSERWRMTNRLQETRFVDRGSSTLGEMLALSDREVLSDVLDPVTAQKISDDELARGMLGTQFYPSAISSRDGWKDECSTNLSRSSSLPASSTVHGAPKSTRQRVSESDNCYMLKDVLNLGMDDYPHGNLNQRRSSSRKSFKFRSSKPHLNPVGEENKLPVREIHVNQEELRNGIHVSDPSEVKPMLSKLSDGNIANSSKLVDSSSVMEPMNAELPIITSEATVQQPVKELEFCDINHFNEIIQETSPDHPQVDSVPSQCGGTGSEYLASSKNADQPSPISVLEHPSEEVESSPECFERVSAGLQDLRMQLQLLRLESDKYNTVCESPVLSEDGITECNSPPQKAEILQAYRNEEDRDYSYLFDMLVNLGFNGTHKYSHLSTYCSLKHPVDLNVFEKLEEKYGVLVEWTRSERKLLFDLIGSALAEILSPSMDQQLWVKPKRELGPIWGCEGFVEEAWKMVVRLRKELSRGNPEKLLDPRWLDLGDDLDTVVREIEGMLKDELLEELISEFILD